MSATHRSLGCVLAAALLTGCADRASAPTQPLALSPGKLNSAGSISDGAHGGNSHFFFLPPLVAPPAYRGTFDASLAPAVSICEWTGTACAAAALASYTTTSGTGGEIVRVSASDYSVNWDTDLGTTLGRTYRVRITVAGTEIGFSDVLLVTNGRDAKNLTTGDVVALVYGRILPLKFRIERGAVAVVGATGGTAVMADGAVSLGFPAGAVSSAIGVTATPIAPGTPAAPDNSVLAGTQYEFQPSPMTFQQPVTLTLSYPATLPPKWHADRLVICKIVGDACQPLSGGSVDTQTRTVSATISGFSAYAIAEFPELSYLGGADVGTSGIFLHTANGERELARNLSPFGPTQYTWAPDGSRLAFIRDVSRTWDSWTREIVIVSVDASVPERTVLGPGSYRDPSWSPDGAHILVSTDEGDLANPQWRFLMVNADGSGVRTFPEIAAQTLWVDAATWSHDGQRIIFSAPVDGSHQSIWAVNVDGTGLTELLPDFYARELFVSPDGSRIAFTGALMVPPGGPGIYVANIDGSGVHQVAIGDNLILAGWSPAALANTLLFADDGSSGEGWGVWVVGADDAPEHARDLALPWSPLTGIGSVAWSVDGTRIVFPGGPPEGPWGLAVANSNATSAQVVLIGDAGAPYRWRP